MTQVSKGGRPAVSVVVPFYNVERCVHYCMDSLLAQTYDDYEVVCVDDGSTDSTGELLDSYASHPRVSVHHKGNGGLSDARNCGVALARGSHVTFVDGDDVVSPYYLEALAGSLGSDPDALVIGLFRFADGREAAADAIQWGRPAAARRTSKAEVVEAYMYETILPGGVCRLAPRELYASRPFPEGVYYEEIATAAGYVADAAGVLVVDEPIYGYVMREGSIVHRRTARFAQVRDYVDALGKFSADAGAHFPPESPAAVHFYSLHYSRIFRLLGAVEDVPGDAVDELRRSLAGAVRGVLPALLGDGRASAGNKLRFATLSWAPGLYCGCIGLYERAIKGRR